LVGVGFERPEVGNEQSGSEMIAGISEVGLRGVRFSELAAGIRDAAPYGDGVVIVLHGELVDEGIRVRFERPCAHGRETCWRALPA
jgi:hypothetical protein